MGLLAVEKFLCEMMPVLSGMGISVERFDADGVEVSVPLAKNFNHCGTAFGGSISTLAIVSAWSLVYCNAVKYDICGDVVIASNSVSYVRPANGDVYALAEIDLAERGRFLRAIERKGVGRMRVASRVFCGNVLVANFEGLFAIAR